ncbi:glutaminyl-peptide cyclotransferase [Sphingomonas sp. Leaf17]|uniref:glutaminyl-peptide cyclotransferase n=1 Tax=Sphingomonas sp. Leaf17 TaxID=1735683 RepID=UPI001F2424BF|nr:glutaminyl-peptide cyclotransferase [Sphingomonas sp. Leaf17]
MSAVPIAAHPPVAFALATISVSAGSALKLRAVVGAQRPAVTASATSDTPVRATPAIRAFATSIPASIPARVIATLPHDPDAFTEGLLIKDGLLYESTGNLGRSVIRVSTLATGHVLREAALAPALFGEGIVDWRDEIVSVTWKTGLGFRWDRATLGYRGSFRYPGEGWGLTHDATSLILSDGTPILRILDPVTFAERRRVTVTANGVPVRDLNELEWVDGEILANVWRTTRIARIEPASGRVKGWIDLSAIAATMPKDDPDSVANGIAWDAKTRRLYVTGKNWPSLFQIAWPPR